MAQLDNLSVNVRLTVVGETGGCTSTMGKGVELLLQGIEDYGSLNRAAKSLGMAYSKAWRIVRETESGFGFPVIDRDGARGSTLTKKGRALLDAYKKIEDELSSYASRRFSEEMGGL